MRCAARSALLAGLWVSAAWAQGADPVTATELFKQGREALQRGDVAVACAKFAESVRLDVKVGTLLNLADCEEKQGRIASARARLVRALDLARAENDDRAGFAKERLEAIDARVPRLTIHLAAGTPAEATVTRDGVALGAASLGSALPVEPGRHTIVVSCPARADASVEITLGEGESRAIEVAPTALEPSREPGPPPTRARVEGRAAGAWMTPAGAITAIAGGAALVGGVIGGLVAMATHSDSKATCDAMNVCDLRGKELRDQARAAGDVSTAMFIAGGALVVAGVILLVAAPRSRPVVRAGDLVIAW